MSTVDAMLVRLDGDRLVMIGNHQRLKHLTCDPAKTIRELRAGRACYLESASGYLDEVKRQLADMVSDGRE